MLPPEKRARIIAALKENPNASAVARQVGGVSDVTVWKIAKQTGIKLAGKGVALSPEKRAQIVAALKTMRNARAVTRQVGAVSLSTVKKIAKQARIMLAGKGVVTTPEKRAKIIAALKANPNATAVAKRLGGVSSWTVWKIAKQTGIKLAAGRAAQGKRGATRKAPTARRAQNSREGAFTGARSNRPEGTKRQSSIEPQLRKRCLAKVSAKQC
jgi:transposase-like protein